MMSSFHGSYLELDGFDMRCYCFCRPGVGDINDNHIRRILRVEYLMNTSEYLSEGNELHTC